jgi:phosphoribosylformylglycinamidine synthase
MDVGLDLVPLRDDTLTPEEILMSESQERMMAVVTEADLAGFLAICAKWDVTATVIGTVTDTGRLTMRWHGELIVDVPPRSLANDGPVYERPMARPAEQDALVADSADDLPRPASGAELLTQLLMLVASPDLADKSWITDQYDRYVLGNTVLAAPENAGVIRVSDDGVRGLALSTDGNGRYARLDPYAGAQLALAEAYRNVATIGARPIAVTNCLNFGSPENPAVMWQFAEAVRGLADAAQTLGVPVTGGNVSFYNQTGAEPILPTPVVGVLGIIDDVTKRVRSRFQTEGAELYLLGETRPEFGGSAWAQTVHGQLGGRPPSVDLGAEHRLATVLVDAADNGLLESAHDISDGGVGQALVESCLQGGRGARVSIPEGVPPAVFLFAESAGRAVISVRAETVPQLLARCADVGVPITRIGQVAAEGAPLSVDGQFEVELATLADASRSVLPVLFG